MTRVDFYGLSRAVQDSLLSSLGGQFEPRPILVRTGAKRRAFAWIGVAVAASIALALVCIVGYGKVESALSLHATWGIAIYVALAGATAAAVLNALSAEARLHALPFPAAIYLFPANIIDARQTTLVVYSLEDVTAVTTQGNEVVLELGGARFSFPVPERSSATDAAAAVERAREKLRSATKEERAKLDPLAPPSVHSPLTPDVPHPLSLPVWEKMRWAIGGAIGVIVGGALFLERNALSDTAMLDWSKQHDDVASYQAYLARGSRYRDIVQNTLLPRAALKLAIGQGTVEAVDDVARAYPGATIQTEIDAARKAALIAELERAKKAETLSSLLSFAERRPNHGLDAQLTQAKHALYMKALERAHADVAEPLWETLGRIVAAAEKAGPHKVEGGYRGLGVKVRFSRMASKELERADTLVRKNPEFNYPHSLLSNQLVPARFDPAEKKTGQVILDRFAKAFDPEYVSFEAGEPLPEGSDLTKLTEPTLAITYRVESSGGAYASKKPRGIFLGLVFFFSADFILPGEAKPHHTKLTFTTRIPYELLREPPEGAGAMEAAMYDEMTRSAFAQLTDTYLGVWFKKPKPQR